MGRIETLNQIKSVMLGHAVADALGVPVEFKGREALRKNPVVGMRGFGTHHVPAGAWSDDTSMALCAFDALCHEDWSFDSVMENFVAWFERGEFTPTGICFDVGRTSMKAILDSICNQKPALKCGCDAEYDNGNGSLMRIHPFVLYAHAKELPLDEWIGLIKDASAITHAHERSKVGCLIYAFVLMQLLRENSKEGVLSGLRRTKCELQDCEEICHYGRIFESGFAYLDESEIRSSGYVVDTLEAALWCILTTESYKECVLKAVNLGEDTDTVAAVAGGLAGALYGYDAIPEEWRDVLIKRDAIEDLCERACDSF